jgi:hypothetical protein
LLLERQTGDIRGDARSTNNRRARTYLTKLITNRPVLRSRATLRIASLAFRHLRI